MIRFIENIGDYYSQHFFTDDFPKKVFDKAGYVTQKKDGDGNKTANHLTEINSRISPLREKYYRFKNDLINLQREKDKVKRTHDFHREVLDALGYINGTPEYHQPVFLNDTEVIPVRYKYLKGGKPYLFVMEMKAIVREGESEINGIFDQIWIRDDWEKVFPNSWGEFELKPDKIDAALSELFLLPENERPVYVIMLAGAKIFLAHYEKWKYDSYLLFDLEELLNESLVPTNRDYLALFYALLAKQNFLGDTDSLLQSLDEDAHKAAYGVTQNLKKGVIYAVESLANEAIWYKKNTAKTQETKDAIEKLMADEKFAKELKDECLTMVYRMLFLFYAEAREDLEILPVKDATYQKGYSLEMLRDLEMVPLTTDSSRNGYFISESLWKLFEYLHNGVRTSNGFEMKPLDSPLFDNDEMKHLAGVQFRNVVLQQIIKHLSLSDQNKGKRRGRISYANLGINQLGSVYESLLAYSGFFAAEPLIEVKAADDPDGKEGTFLVPLIRRDDFKEEEILKDSENPQYDKQIPKGHFVYRLNGRDRKKSASYYTPEVLTQTTVKYTLKGIIDSLKERQKKGEDCADEILALKILEPAMGAAAFHNEVINQLADAYLELKEEEEVRKGRKRIVPGNYADEMQKVKAFIAANNVYGVDLNPTAVELGKLSLWLNCMHKNMETPFFAHRLGTGNAVVGCWLKVYNEKEVIAEYPASEKNKKKPKPIAKTWWDKAPTRIGWNKKGELTRKQKQFYHFLLPDENMLSSFSIGLIKEELNDAQKKAVTEWKKEFKQPLSTSECVRLEKLCKVIDTLLEEHYRQIKGIIKDTTSAYAVYGQINPQMPIKGYDEKERLAESRNARSAPYYKLRMVMDYWCSLWFWDARNIVNWPTREQWYNEIENILGVDLSSMPENADSTTILANIKKNAADTSGLFGSEERLYTVEELREQHRFFHHELEFLEVFRERGGFDVIAGNPPWVSIEFDEAGVLSDDDPKILLSNLSAPQVKIIATKIIKEKNGLKNRYLTEYIAAEGIKAFIGSFQNYGLLDGQRNNLYKCVLVNSLGSANRNGFIGLIHPEGVYDDPKADSLRKEIYSKLKYHFQFRNEFSLFSEVMHTRNFSINIYRGEKSAINFFNINNLFHPITIDSSFTGMYNSECPGIKIFDKKKDRMEWNTTPHQDRVVNISEEDFIDLSKQFENCDDPFSIPLPTIHSKQILSALKKVFGFKGSVSNFDCFVTDGLNETNAPKSGIIIEKTEYPNSSNDVIYSGPQIYTGNPIYRNPKIKCEKLSDYDIVDLSQVKSNFLPRVNYLPNSDKIFGFIESFVEYKDIKWVDYYKCTFNKMLDSAVERTLKSTILPKGFSHTNGLISVIFQDTKKVVELSGICSSIILDFVIKSSGKGNIYDNTIKLFPLGIEKIFLDKLMYRTLLLNCLIQDYKLLWEECWNDEFLTDEWSKSDNRLSNLSQRSANWAINSPIRNYFERRLALIEIDVIVSMAIGLDLDELILIYEVQFPVLQQNEDDTWYDQRGNIVFTCSKGLIGVGLDRPEWDNLTEEVNPMQRKLKEGEAYTHTITKSELYEGQQITYYAPFDKCDRVEDYKVAWAHFEKVFGK